MTYPGAYHAWTVPGLTTCALRRIQQYWAVSVHPARSGRPELLIDGQLKPFDPNSFGACIAEAPGYSMAYDAAVRTKSAADAVEFLQRHLRP